MKIIILDDSLTVRMIIEAYLEELGVEDNDIYPFENGIEAIKYIDENGADIIFTDVHMPKMDGYEFVKKVLEYNSALASSIFVISGDEDKAGIKKMKSIGVQRFIKKPINKSIFNHFVAPEIDKRLKR